jgi:hypothetical protein
MRRCRDREDTTMTFLKYVQAFGDAGDAVGDC